MKFGPYEYVSCSKAQPCPICGRSKYCCLSADGMYVFCTKIGDGAIKKWRKGWLHKMQEARPVQPEPPKPPVDQATLMAIYRSLDKRPDALMPLALNLGLPVGSLTALNCGKFPTGEIWGTPMVNEFCELIGIKCRSLEGKKWCVRGSRLGLYVPRLIHSYGSFLICEGESDTAAALCTGLTAIGRPSVNSGEEYLLPLLQRISTDNRNAYIAADRDASGIGLTAAWELADKIRPLVMKLFVLYNPNYKDLREWYCSGSLNGMSMIQYGINYDEYKHQSQT